MAGGLRRFDAFAKTRKDLQKKSALGGLITLVATTSAGILFLTQIILYIRGDTQHSLRLAISKSIPITPLEMDDRKRPASSKIMDRIGKIPLSVHVTFPHVECRRLDFIHDGASLANGELAHVHKEHSIRLRTPTSSEMAQVFKNNNNLMKQHKVADGCTVFGQLRIPIVAGTLAISLSRMGWAEATQIITLRRVTQEDASGSSLNEALHKFNVSHYIHYVRFGAPYSVDAAQPMENRFTAIENMYGGIALDQIQVKLVPTLVNNFLSTSRYYQMSVVDHQVQPQTLVAHGVPHLPGLLVAYDFNPLAVHHTDGRDNILVFLSSLISIVGGVFVTVSLLTGCLVHSAKAVAKKID
jgi:Endoplasmic reticulum vesicle transporter/Endoplasmic Reticulum-Golgi Intermediate Compartment (ERGIC)